MVCGFVLGVGVWYLVWWDGEMVFCVYCVFLWFGFCDYVDVVVG